MPQSSCLPRSAANCATVPPQTFTIDNLAANTSAQYTANLKLTGFTSSNPAFQTNLATFNGLTALSGSNGQTFTASLNTSSNMSGSGTITMSASQLADDSSLPGVGNNNSGALTITLDANVGNATADASNSQTSFGTPLTALVAKNASYANLASTVSGSAGSGGYNLIGSTATILAGTNASSGTSQTVSMAWQTQTLQERTSPMLLSDVVDLSGMTLDGTSQTSPFGPVTKLPASLARRMAGPASSSGRAQRPSAVRAASAACCSGLRVNMGISVAKGLGRGSGP